MKRPSGSDAPRLASRLLSARCLILATPAASGNAPFFDFQGVGNVFHSGLQVTGTTTFTINGGAARTFEDLVSGVARGSQAATDVYILGSTPGLSVGHTMVLTAGTLTTTANFAGAPPVGLTLRCRLCHSRLG